MVKLIPGMWFTGLRLRKKLLKRISGASIVQWDSWARTIAGYVEDSADPAKNSLMWYSSEEQNLLASEKLCKVLIDSDDELMPFTAGSVLKLQEGYELVIKGVDVEGKKINVALRKDEKDLDEKVIVLDEDTGTYLFKTSLGSGDSNKVSPLPSTLKMPTMERRLIWPRSTGSGRYPTSL